MNTKRKIKVNKRVIQIVTICRQAKCDICNWMKTSTPTPHPRTKNSSDLDHLKKWTWSWLGGSGPLDPPGQLRPWIKTMPYIGTNMALIWQNSPQFYTNFIKAHRVWLAYSVKADPNSRVNHSKIKRFVFHCLHVPFSFIQTTSFLLFCCNFQRSK